MKINAVERVLFVAGFVLAAGICLGFLFGYRYSFDQQRLEQRGVLVLGGVMDGVTVTVHGTTKTVTLPYVDANIPLGRHHVSVTKTGYIPFETDVDVNTDDAVIVQLSLAPQLLTGQKATYGQEGSASYFRGLGVVMEQTSSGMLMTHAEDPKPITSYLPTVLRQGKNAQPLKFTRISDTSLLVQRDRTSMIYNAVRATWKTIQHANSEELLTDQGMVLAYDAKAGTVRYVNLETGKPDTRPFLDSIKSVEPSKVVYVSEGEGYRLYKDTEGYLFRLQPRWFSFPAVEPLGDLDRLSIKNSSLSITSTGALLNASEKVVLEGVQNIFVQQDAVIATTEDYGAYTLNEEGKIIFLTRFSSPIVSIQPEPSAVYSFVQTQQALYFCERKTLQRCTQLASGAENSLQRGVDKEGRYLWYSDGSQIHLVPFFRP